MAARINEADTVRNRFIDGLGRISEHQQTVVDVPEMDSKKENTTFILFCIFMGLVIAASVVFIALADPFYKRTSGSMAEFFMTLGIHAIVITGILKVIRQDEPVLKHILAGLSISMFLGSAMLLLRVLTVPDKPMVWVIIPLLAKFRFIETVSPWFTIACALVPLIFQFMLLSLFYRTDKMSLILPFITYSFVANSIVAFIMLSPLVGGV